MKQVPDENILLFKSCLVSVEYPGIESSTKFVFDKIGIDYDISDKQTRWAYVSIFSITQNH